MRKINTGDVCKCARILKYTGVREKIVELIKQGQSIQAKSKDAPEVQEFGFAVIFEFIEILAEQKAEHEIYDLIGGIVEKTAEEIAEQEFTATIEDVKAIARENDLKGFFLRVSDLTGLK